MAWSGREISEADQAKMRALKEKASPALASSLEASFTERCLGRFFAPYVLSNVGRIIFGVIYLILIFGGIYGCTQLEVAFDFDYFISEESDVYTYNQANDKYFNRGASPTVTYVENPAIDFTTVESQKKMLKFN